MKPSRIQAITHVNLEATLGLEDELRWFYGELAELAADDLVAVGKRWSCAFGLLTSPELTL